MGGHGRNRAKLSGAVVGPPAAVLLTSTCEKTPRRGDCEPRQGARAAPLRPHLAEQKGGLLAWGFGVSRQAACHQSTSASLVLCRSPAWNSNIHIRAHQHAKDNSVLARNSPACVDTCTESSSLGFCHMLLTRLAYLPWGPNWPGGRSRRIRLPHACKQAGHRCGVAATRSPSRKRVEARPSSLGGAGLPSPSPPSRKLRYALELGMLPTSTRGKKERYICGTMHHDAVGCIPSCGWLLLFSGGRPRARHPAREDPHPS